MDHIVIVSTVNQYRVLNQVFELIFKLPGQHHLKIIHVFYTINVYGGEYMVHQTIQCTVQEFE